MKILFYLASLLIVISLCGCGSLAIAVGEKLGHLGKEPIGTVYTREVECIVQTDHGIEIINRKMTSEIVGHQEMAGSVRAQWKDEYEQGRELVFSNKKGLKLVLNMPSGFSLGRKKETLDSIHGGYLVGLSGDKKFLGYVKLLSIENFNKYGFRLISMNTRVIEK